MVRDLDHDRPVCGVGAEREPRGVSEDGEAVDRPRQEPSELERIVVEPEVARPWRSDAPHHPRSGADVEERPALEALQLALHPGSDRPPAAVLLLELVHAVVSEHRVVRAPSKGGEDMAAAPSCMTGTPCSRGNRRSQAVHRSSPDSRTSSLRHALQATSSSRSSRSALTGIARPVCVPARATSCRAGATSRCPRGRSRRTSRRSSCPLM